MLQAWHAAGALTYAGYILGFPGDTPASIARDIGIIQRELPIDILEFFILTPLPGSADHRDLHAAGVAMDRDLNNYDVVHVTTRHALMTDAELAGIYAAAWDLYYSPAHVETVLRRAKSWGYDLNKMMWKLLSFHAPHKLENVHPLDGGVIRRKYRRDRRPGLALEHPVDVSRARELALGPQVRAIRAHVLELPQHHATRGARHPALPGSRDDASRRRRGGYPRAVHGNARREGGSRAVRTPPPVSGSRARARRAFDTCNPPRERRLMMELLVCLKKYGQRLDWEIAEEMGLSVGDVRRQFATLSATGEVIACKLTRFENGKEVEAVVYRASGYFPPAAPGRKPNPPAAT